MREQEAHASAGGVQLAAPEAVRADPTAAWALARTAEVLNGLGLAVTGPGNSGSVQPVLRILAALDDGCEGAPEDGEAFSIRRPGGPHGDIAVVGRGPRGLCYGLLELADIALHSPDPLRSLRQVGTLDERPATPVRGISRLFSCEAEDKPWFHDREFWTEYLTKLASHRINRFQLALGMQYNYSHHVARDNYLYLAYPFLLDVPGYDVRAVNLPAEEQQRNLSALRFASEEAKRRGIHFQLGLWNHAYEMLDGPVPNYPISGLTPGNHADYCGAALVRLLRTCPAIDGLTLRVHYEGGIPVILEPETPFEGRVLLHYRHLNQAESYQTTPMRRVGARFEAEVPTAYTASSYPVCYLFTVVPEDGCSYLFPGINPTFSSQPYYVIRRKIAS